MRQNDKDTIPTSAWIAYFSLVAVGAALGVLTGANAISGASLAVFILSAIAGFIPWAIWNLDPESLEESDAYKKDESGRSANS
jgi:hypothetical protein